jgi:ribosomal-protein-alanine N-acetyltransferase
MKFLSSFLHLSPSSPRPPLDTQLIGARILLRIGDVDDWKAWHNLRETSRDFLVPWEPKWRPDALSYQHYCGLLRRQWREWRNGTGFAFSIFNYAENDEHVLIGGLTLSDVTFAAGQKATLGYWIGNPYKGQGYMTEAVGLACGFAFETLGLNRVEASCLPHNEASKTVLNRTGFEQEGYAKAYLQINGKREDHILWGKVNPAFRKETPDAS